jgi:molecular chaperone DnaK (HSP70)
VRLGIDFGTTRTVIAAAHDGRHPVAAFDLGDAYGTWLPGLAAWDGQQWSFGAEAAAALRDGKPGLRSVKRAVSPLAPGDPVVVDGVRTTSALELAARFLGWVRTMLVTRGNLELAEDEPLDAMIAVPANASSRQRFLTLEAFRAAGFGVLGMVNEPTAAAIEFAHRNQRVLSPRSPKRYLVVYDLGGGTFDTAAVSLEGRRFELLHSEGIGRLGGEDFDELIFALALDEWGIDERSIDPSARVALLEVCRAAKETLTAHSQRLLIDPVGYLDVAPAVIDARALYARAEPIVARTIDLLDRVFARLPEHGLDPDDARELGAVYLVGGGVAFPAVARGLRARYERKTQLAPEPHAATAIGLAVAADDEAGVLVREASTRYLGVWREALNGRETIFDPILRKDTLPDADAPLVVRRRYRPTHTVGHLRFVECTRLDEGGRPDGHLTPFSELYFPYDPRLASAPDLAALPIERTGALGDEIVETYTYGHDGRIVVTMENVTRRYRRELELGALSSG